MKFFKGTIRKRQNASSMLQARASRPLDDKAWAPTHHGLLIPVKFAGELRKAIDQLIEELESQPEGISQDSKA